MYGITMLLRQIKRCSNIESRERCLFAEEPGLGANIGKVGQAFEGHCPVDGSTQGKA